MNPKIITGLISVSLGAVACLGQGTFQNLDFEAAKLVFLVPGEPFIATSNALPGWTATYGSSELTAVPYGPAGIMGLVGKSDFGGAIDGNFSASISGGAISQTGLVPADARSLQFKVRSSGAAPNEGVEVWLGGESLPLVGLAAPRGYFLVGADISSFAGQTETLSFSGGSRALDDIAFWPQIVREPGGAALFLLGVGMLTSVRRRGCSPPRRASGAAAAC